MGHEPRRGVSCNTGSGRAGGVHSNWMLSGILSDELKQEATDICSDLSGEAGSVNKKSLKKIFISGEVMHQSLQGRRGCPEVQENACVKVRSEAHVAFIFCFFDINRLAHGKLISQGPPILYG